jgi:peroxiredoxin
MKKTIFLFIAAIVFGAVAIGHSAVSANDFTIGSTVEEFKLKDTDGAEKSFSDLAGKKGTVIVFLSAQCPVVKAYNARLKQIADDYESKGINFIGLNSNSTESLEWVKSHAKENYPFPMLIDTDNVIADKFNANATPEIFFFDSNKKLVYHGAIDNDRSGENITNKYLSEALDQHLNGQAIAKAETKAFGCTIKRKQ